MKITLLFVFKSLLTQLRFKPEQWHMLLKVNNYYYELYDIIIFNFALTALP